MKVYTLKSIAQRGALLGAAFALAVSTVTPFAPAAFADALNPLTDRSLTLSSSSPGWDYLDGSGNPTYAPPNSGANGQKVGNTFEFKVTTDTTGATKLRGMTFKYCTAPAGNCTAPGDNGQSGGVRNADSATTTDLSINLSNPSEATLGTYVDTSASNGRPTSIPAANATGNNYMVYYRTSDGGTPNDPDDDSWAQSTGWVMSAYNGEIGGTISGGTATGRDNEIMLTNNNVSGPGFASGTVVRVVFFATDDNYITNPGSGSFFVRINTYSTLTTTGTGDLDDNGSIDGGETPLVVTGVDQNSIIDGGVTVANVMNKGIQITTKVLETMDFSVGTVDPYTLEAAADNPATSGVDEAQTSQLYLANGHEKHGVCDPVLKKFALTDTETNRIQLGDAGAEFSLKTDTTYSGHSYWRLSSNSSAGATVYYSGNTLTNTVGDSIQAIGATAAAPLTGTEQFGLAIANGSRAANTPYFVPPSTNPDNVFKVNYNTERSNGKVYENGADNAAAGLADPLSSGIHSSVTDDAISNVDANADWHASGPRLWPLIPGVQYDRGAGVVNTGPNGYGSINTAFAFDTGSMIVPVPLATQDTQVVDCVTAKMRYIANISATTPAGIYTTKVNYIASPQY